jgi:signal transduction histidine kinase
VDRLDSAGAAAPYRTGERPTSPEITTTTPGGSRERHALEPPPGETARSGASVLAVTKHAPSNPEREQTDESLRVEREKADAAIDIPSEIDETADAVVRKARERADVVLARARQKVDRLAASLAPGSVSPAVVALERAREDDALRRERATADQAVYDARAELAVEVAVGREETDADLSRERAGADQAIATRDEFLGLVSHDLRNMLASVVGFAGLIEAQQARADHADQVLGYVKRIQRAGSRMDRLVGDLLDLASIHAGSMAVVAEMGDLAPVVTEAVDSFQAQAEAGGVSLVARMPPSLPRVPLDAARILQVLVNLLSNALKFTPANGAVTVRVEQIDRELRVTVEDSGKGIPAEKLTEIFERFVQVSGDRRGVGLGLYISKCIVLGHGGRIWAESNLGGGSSFHLTLPIPAAA